MTQDPRLFIIWQVLCVVKESFIFKDDETNDKIWLDVRQALKDIEEDLARLKGLEK